MDMTDMNSATATARRIGRRQGEVILDLQNISLRFGGVKALTDISFNVREHEIRSIIGPNGAGKSSMLNVINGVYHPQEGRSSSAARSARRWSRTWRPPGHRPHLPEHRAVQGHERARQHHDRAQPEDEVQPLPAGAVAGAPAQKEEIAHRDQGRGGHRLPRDPAHPQDAGGPLPYGLQKRVELGRALAMPSPSCCCSTSRWRA
jgi:branched-chain amino acid transport system ATP-binding protein